MAIKKAAVEVCFIAEFVVTAFHDGDVFDKVTKVVSEEADFAVITEVEGFPVSIAVETLCNARSVLLIV